jgi:hypothetical protein
MRVLSSRPKGGLAMPELTTALLGKACRIFLNLAYPAGAGSVPPPRNFYLDITPQQSLDSLLVPPVCQTLAAPGGELRGYALRLGSASYPHLKLQVIDCDQSATWVFAVDTHDALRLGPNHPDAPGWGELQASNRRLKEQIERAWEAEGLLTFNGLLRRGLDRK